MMTDLNLGEYHLAINWGAYFERLLIPLIILIIVMVLDHISGIANAFFQAKLSAMAGFKGIAKKASALSLIVVGCVIDWLLIAGLSIDGSLSAAKGFVGLLLCLWLTLNELISILENLSALGVPILPQLIFIVKRLKQENERRFSVDKASMEDNMSRDKE